MATALKNLENSLYALATEFPRLKPTASSPNRFTSFCPIHGLDKQSDLVWTLNDSDVVITCKVCGSLTIDQIRNPKEPTSRMKEKQVDPIVDLAIEEITVNTAAQSRASIDTDLVSEYAELMRDGVIFPPITVFSDSVTHWLSEGFHRLAAYREAAFSVVPCTVKPGGLREAILLSVGSNAAHGRQRSNADKRRAVELLLKDDEWNQWSSAEIARRCAVSEMTVGRIRAESISNNVSDTHSTVVEPVRTATRNGTTYQLKTAKIGKVKPAVMPEPEAKPIILAMQPLPEPEIADSEYHSPEPEDVIGSELWNRMCPDVGWDVIELILTLKIPAEYHAELVIISEGWEPNGIISRLHGTAVEIKGFAWWDEKSGAVAKRRLEAEEQTTFGFVERLRSGNSGPIADLLRCADHFGSFDGERLKSLRKTLADIRQAHNAGMDELESRINTLLMTPVEKDITPLRNCVINSTC